MVLLNLGMADSILVVIAVASLAIYSIVNVLGPPVVAAIKERSAFRQVLLKSLENMMIPVGIGAIVALGLQNQSGIDLLLSSSTKVEVFLDTATFFEDLRRETLHPSIKNSYVTLIRYATNEEYSGSAAVNAYYESVLERCEDDESFTLWRVFGVTTEKMLEEAKIHAHTAKGLPNYELKIFRWMQRHDPINLVVLEDEQGPSIVYIIVPPSSKARLQTIKITGSREIAQLFRQYHYNLFTNSVRPTEEEIGRLEEQL